jgi:hypothetical protein
VNYLEVRAVVPGMRVCHDGIDPATGAPVRTTVYSGHIALARNTGFRGAVRAGELQPVGVYIPDGALAQPPAAIGVELSVRRFTSLGGLDRLDLGASDEQVSAPPDPRGNGHWLYLTFRTPIQTHELLELNYRITVQAPRPAG